MKKELEAAFARPHSQDAEYIHHAQPGMTLRDYLAGQALAGGLEQGVEDNMQFSWWHDPTKIAKRAYAVADAMLKVREA